MIAAVYPETCSEELTDGLTLAGASQVGIAELSPDAPALGDVDLLVVELGPQPMRRLRELDRVAETVGLPVIVIATHDQRVMSYARRLIRMLDGRIVDDINQQAA